MDRYSLSFYNPNHAAALVSAIQELYLEAKVRFITGRPRKAEKRLQMKKFMTKKKVCENKFSWGFIGLFLKTGINHPRKSGIRVSPQGA